MCLTLLEVEPRSPKARSFPAKHTHTPSLTLSLSLRVLWVHRHCGLMGTTYHACSFSAPPPVRAHQGSPGRCCVNFHTTPAAPGLEGSSVGKEARGSQGGSSSLPPPLTRGDVPSQPGGAVLAPTMDMWIQSQPQESHTGIPFYQAISNKLHRHGRPWDAPPLCFTLPRFLTISS